MKQTAVRLWLFTKRLAKRPMYLAILLLMPIVTLLLSKSQEGESVGIKAYLYTEQENLDFVQELLEAGPGIITFAMAESEEALKQAVLAKEADCGYVFSADFADRLVTDDWKRSVRLYCGEDVMIPMLVNEVVYTAVFRAYSENTFMDYAGTVFTEAAGGSLEAQKQAGELLNVYLTNGSTFSFSYHGTMPQADQLSNESEKMLQEEQQEAALMENVVPVRGMLALFMMLCACCGLVDYKRDREAGRLVWTRHRLLTQLMMILLPAMVAAIISLLCLFASGVWNGTIIEITNVIIYICLLAAYTVLWGVVFRSEHAVVASIPFLLLATILFCPIFWNLKSVLPIFQVMEKLFPVSWYLSFP